MRITLILIIISGCQRPDLLLIIAAIEQVESGGDTNAIGDNGLAVGCLPIEATKCE